MAKAGGKNKAMPQIFISHISGEAELGALIVGRLRGVG
jgi:hypothetical protein